MEEVEEGAEERQLYKMMMKVQFPENILKSVKKSPMMMLMITKVLKEENLKHLRNEKIKVLFLQSLNLQNIHHLKNLMTVMKIIVMMPVQLVEEEENLKQIQNMKKKIKVLLLQRQNLQNVHHWREEKENRLQLAGKYCDVLSEKREKR